MRKSRRLTHSLLLLLSALIPHFSSAVPHDPRNINPVEVGSELPETALKDKSGKDVPLRNLLNGQKSVIIFYRGSWCPYCTRHLAAVGAHEQAILEKGYKIIAIAPDKVETIRKYAKGTAFNYELYSDADMAAADAFGLSFELDATTLKKLDSYDIDIEAASGKDHHQLPVPAVFITNAQGRITFRYYNPDYTKRLSPEQLLEAIQ